MPPGYLFPQATCHDIDYQFIRNYPEKNKGMTAKAMSKLLNFAAP
jgi:hypothetical protein